MADLLTQALNIVRRAPRALDVTPLESITAKGTSIRIYNEDKLVTYGKGTLLQKFVKQKRDIGDFNYQTLFKMGEDGKAKAVALTTETPAGKIELCGIDEQKKIFMNLENCGYLSGANIGTVNRPKTNLYSTHFQKWLTEADSEKLIKAVKKGNKEEVEKICKEIGLA